jgi:hypothetical protein
MNKRALIITALIFIGVILAAVAAVQVFAPTGTLTLAVIPSDATITVDGKPAKTNKLTLTPGNHTVAASRADFKTKTVTVNIKPNGEQTENFVLNATSPEALAKWQAEHPDQIQESEGVAGAEANAQGAVITQNNPLIQLLPYVGADYRIDFGVSQKHANDQTAVAIYITAATPAAKTHALDWIKAQGYDPGSLEIIYQ